MKKMMMFMVATIVMIMSVAVVSAEVRNVGTISESTCDAWLLSNFNKADSSIEDATFYTFYKLVFHNNLTIVMGGNETIEDYANLSTIYTDHFYCNDSVAYNTFKDVLFREKNYTDENIIEDLSDYYIAKNSNDDYFYFTGFKTNDGRNHVVTLRFSKADNFNLTEAKLQASATSVYWKRG